MRRDLRPFVWVLVLVGALAAWWLTRPSEEKRVRKQFTRLAERFSKTEGEKGTTMAIKLNRLSDLFDDTLTVQVRESPANGTYDAAEISSHVARIRPMFAAIQLSFHDLKVTLKSETEAEGVVTARLRLHPRDGDPSVETREITALLVRSDDDTWRFRSFREEQVMLP